MAKIVIIDDDDAVRDSLQTLLETYGYEVRQYTCAEEFLGRSSDKVNCLLEDQHIPGMTGLDLLEHMDEAGSSQCRYGTI